MPKPTNPYDPQEWLSPTQAAELLKVTTARIRQLSIEGRLPFVTTANGRLYPRQEMIVEAERRRQRRGEAE